MNMKQLKKTTKPTILVQYKTITHDKLNVTCSATAIIDRLIPLNLLLKN